MDNDFLERVHRDLLDLRRQSGALAAKEAAIRRDREQLSGKIASLEEAARVYREVMVLPEPENEQRPGSELFHRIPPGTIADMAEFILSERGGPTRVADIARTLESVGKLSASRDESGRGNYGTVYGTLRRDERFVRTGQGEFDLRDRHEADPEELTLRGEPTQPGLS